MNTRPSAANEASVLPAPRAGNETSPENASTHPLQVLVALSDPAEFIEVHTAIQALGDSVTLRRATCPAEALCALRVHPHDVVIADSRDGGEDLLHEMAVDGADTPLVLITDEGTRPTDPSVVCRYLPRRAIGCGLRQVLEEAVHHGAPLRRAGQSQSWWRSGGARAWHSGPASPPAPLSLEDTSAAAPARPARSKEGSRTRGADTLLLANVQKNVPLLLGRTDESGHIAEISGDGLLRLHGLHPGVVLGTHFTRFFPAGCSALDGALRGGSGEFEWERTTFHVAFDRARGSGAVFFAHRSPSANEDTRRLLDAVDAERRRIGADLHDEVGQLLTGIACLSTALSSRLSGRDDLTAEDALTIAQVANQALQQVRLLARGLTAPGLSPEAFHEALLALARQVRRMHDVEVRVQLARGLMLEPEAAAHLFRIVQEAVSNALRHGRATRLTVSLSHPRGRGAALRVHDNGCGINPAAPVDGSGLGLMRYRATLLGGEFRLGAAPEGGTAVEVLLPLACLSPERRSAG